jgi:hypothetical protein
LGYGEYSHAAHVALTQRRTRGHEPTFDAGLDPRMAAHGALRECRDSDEHPASLGVVFVLDVTGSMGDIPRDLAQRTLPGFMEALLDARVPHPSVCFMAVGHARDRAPLQVGQFESTASLIDSWLTRIWLEGGGAGRHECYELALLFAGRRMVLDSVEQRGERGFLFLTADTAPNPAVSRVEAQRILGIELDVDLPIRTVLAEVQRRFEPFVLLAPGVSGRVERAWRDLLGDRVVRMADAGDAAVLAAGLVALMRGSVDGLGGWVRRLEQQGMRRRQAARVATALMPFAASVGRDGAPRTTVKPLDLPRGDAPSGLSRA